MRALVLLIAGLLTWQQTPTFRSGIDVVSVDVSVRDRIRVVTGLSAADFDVLDNGVRQEVTDVSFDKLPIDVTLALDVSRSVSGDTLDRLRPKLACDRFPDAAPQAYDAIFDADRLRLITFSARISRVVDFTHDVDAVSRALRAASAGGGTSIFDTITTAVVSADQADRRQLLVLFSDGADSTSITDPAALYGVAERTNVAITTVMPASTRVVQAVISGTQITTFRAPTPMSGRSQIYAKLATDTGGQVIPQIDGGDLTSTFRRALDQFRSSYVLHFTPKGVPRGGFHTLMVSVPARKGVTVRARRGYSID